MGRRLVILLVALASVAAACGEDAGSGSAVTTTTAGPVLGPFAVTEALAVADGRMQVSGSILRIGIQSECGPETTCPEVMTELHLCGALTRSLPPQCVGDFFYLRGLDPAAIEFQEARDGTGWTAPVLITGHKQGQAFIGEIVETG